MNQIEIAEHFQISQSTVSRILKHPDSTKFSRELRQKILAFIRANAPNLLEGGHTFDLILAAPKEYCQNDFYRQMFFGAQQQANALDYSLLFVDLDRLPTQLEKRKFDGIVVSLDDIRTQRPAYDGPLVLLNVTTDDGSLDSIMPDNIAAVAQALNYLRNVGCERIAYFTFTTFSPFCAQHIWERQTAYLKFCHESGMSERWFRSCPIHYGHPEEEQEAFRQAFKEFCAANILPDAVICHDYYAKSLFTVLNEFSLCVPDDISVIGLDNLDQFAALPFLASIDFHMEEIGAQAVRRLHSLICNPQQSHIRTSVQPELILRKSVRQLFETKEESKK